MATSFCDKGSGKSKLQSKEITTKRKIEQVMGNVVRLESQKRSGYEQYVLGKLSKEKFLELKQGLENEITTLKQTKAEKEKELAVVQEELQREKQIAGSTAGEHFRKTERRKSDGVGAPHEKSGKSCRGNRKGRIDLHI